MSIISQRAGVKKRKIALVAVPALAVLLLAAIACGAQAVSSAAAVEAEDGTTIPQLTASSETSREALDGQQPISGIMTVASDGDGGEGRLPQLTASSETSRANLEGLQDVSYLDGTEVPAAASGGAPASSAPAEAQAADEDITELVGESFSMQADCTVCHSKELENMQIEGFTGYNHRDLACTQCHDDEAELAAAHEEYSVRQASRVVALVNTTVDEAICFSCHGSREELAAATADSTVLVDENGTVVNPHDLPEGSQHDIACGSCHKMHNDLTTEQTAQNTCLTCHHANVYECNTCHVA